MVVSLLAWLSAQDTEAPVAVAADVRAAEVWRHVRRWHDRIRNLEYLVRYDTGRIVDGVRDFVWQRGKVASRSRLWFEEYHSDESGRVGFDNEWRIRFCWDESAEEIRPVPRTLRKVPSAAVAALFQPPDIFLVALGWWPIGNGGLSPRTEIVPLSVLELLASADDPLANGSPNAGPGKLWRLRERQGGVVQLYREDLVMEIDVEPALGYAIRRRMFRARANTVTYEVENFLDVSGLSLPRAVKQTVRTPNGHDFMMRCWASELRINHLSESDFQRPHLPGLYDISNVGGATSGDDDFRIRQVEPGGVELLRYEAEKLRSRFQRRVPWRWLAWVCAFAAGCSLAWWSRARSTAAASTRL